MFCCKNNPKAFEHRLRSEILTVARLAVSRATRIRWPNPSIGAPVRGTFLWASGGVRDAKFLIRAK